MNEIAIKLQFTRFFIKFENMAVSSNQIHLFIAHFHEKKKVNAPKSTRKRILRLHYQKDLFKIRVKNYPKEKQK